MATLAEEIAKILNSGSEITPDPEDFGDVRSNIYKSETIDVAPGKLRRQAALLAFDEDRRYIGKKTSRTKLLNDNDDEDDDAHIGDSEENDSSHGDAEFAEFEGNREVLGTNVDMDDDDDVSEDNSFDEDLDDGDDDDSSVESVDDDTVRTFSKPKDQTSEEEKGRGVVAQFSLWDSLLDIRMKEQQLLADVNQLPQPDQFQIFEEDIGDAVKKAQIAFDAVLEELVQLQANLLSVDCLDSSKISNSKHLSDDGEITSESETDDRVDKKEIKNDMNRKRKLDESIGEYIEKRHTSFESYRNEILENSSQRVNSFSKPATKDFKSFNTSIVKQINQILNDKARLIERTRLKRTIFKVLGKEDDLQRDDAMEQSEQESQLPSRAHLKTYDNEIFDDDDFYYQLLTEVTKRKTMSMKDLLDVSKHWAEIGKIRKSKKIVDQKASKGRRTRYNVHKKLVKFMAPVQNQAVWSSNQRDGLFRELFKSTSTTENGVNWMFV